MEITQEQYEKLQAAKERKELLAVMRKISEQMAAPAKENDFSEVAQAIDRNTDKINSFVRGLSEIVSEPERDDTQLLGAINDMQKALLAGLSELKECMKKEHTPPTWEFEIKRNRFDYIEKVIGIPKI